MDKLFERLKQEIKDDVLKNINSLDEVITAKEACILWGLNHTTVTKLITTTNKLVEGIDYRKSGGTWLITKSAMFKIYGELKTE